MAPNVVFFDLETTGLTQPIRPVQIGAIDSWGRHSYNQYVHPGRSIEPGATKVNKLFLRSGSLFRVGEGDELDTMDLAEALQDFLNWLENTVGGNCVLIAHNCFNYDAKVLIESLHAENMFDDYDHIITGFSDSLLASQRLYHGPPHKLSAMMSRVGLVARETHDALEDAENCRRICRRMAPAAARCSFMDFVLKEDWYRTTNDQRGAMFNGN